MPAAARLHCFLRLRDLRMLAIFLIDWPCSYDFLWCLPEFRNSRVVNLGCSSPRIEILFHIFFFFTLMYRAAM
jgi:hypothetical protein